MPTNVSSNPIQNRPFGVELEIVGLSQSRAAEVISNAGVRCVAESYNHAARTWWKAVTDGSIVDHRNGGRYDTCCEVVSPILKGEEGIATLRAVCKALAAAGATVNKTTGLHVHVNARDLTAREIATCVKRYANHESVIDSLMPNSRRANNNRFCQSVIEVASTPAFNSATTVDGLLSVFRNRFYGDQSRYVKLNLESYVRHGSIEFRQHSGSINAEKVTNWVRFCVNFVEQTRKIVASSPVDSIPVRRGPGRPRRNAAATPAVRGRRPSANNARTRILNALIEAGDYNYLTISQLATVGRIGEASVPATLSALRRSGARIRNSRWSGYCITNATTVRELALLSNNAAPALPARNNTVVAIPADDTCFSGLSDSIIAYYNERIADLAA